MKKIIFLLFILLSQKQYAGTITRLHICCHSACPDMKGADSTVKCFDTDVDLVYYKGNSCCVESFMNSWDQINAILKKYTSSVTHLIIDNPSACLNKLIPLSHFKKLKTIFFNGDDEDYDFDSIPADIFTIKSLRKIKLNRIDHSLTLKKQIKAQHKNIRVRISPRHFRRKEDEINYWK